MEADEEHFAAKRKFFADRKQQSRSAVPMHCYVKDPCETPLPFTGTR